VEEEQAQIETKPEGEKAKGIISARKALSVKKDLNESAKRLELEITNTVGFILENVKIRVVTIDDMFEKNPWITTIKEMFPFESVEIEYNVDQLEGQVLIEADSEEYGKIFSRTLKFSPK